MPVVAMSPERGHTHELIPKDDFVRADGIRTIWSSCICGLEEKRSFRATDRGVIPHNLEYRLGGVWMPPLDLIRRRDLPVVECPICEGSGDQEGTARLCPTCAGLRVVDEATGYAIQLRAPAPISEPQPPTPA